MRVSPYPHYVPVNDEEIAHANRVVFAKYKTKIPEQALRICANQVGTALFAGEPFLKTVRSVLGKRLPDSSSGRRALYEDAIRVIFGKRHVYAAQHAKVHGQKEPQPPFTRIPYASSR